MSEQETKPEEQVKIEETEKTEQVEKKDEEVKPAETEEKTEDNEQQKKEEEEQKAAEQKKLEEEAAAEQKKQEEAAAEQKKQEEEAAEQKKKEEEQAAEQKKQEEEQAEQKKQEEEKKQKEEEQKKQEEEQKVQEEPKTEAQLRQEKFEKMIKDVLVTVKEQAVSSNWKISDQSSKKDLTGYVQEIPSPNSALTRGKAVIDGQFDDIFDVVSNQHEIKKAKAMNSMQKDACMLEKLTDNLWIIYIETSPPIISNRYSIVLYGKIQEGDTWYILSKSLHGDDVKGLKTKETKKLVEVTIDFAAYVLTPKGNSTVVDVITNIDIGDVPEIISNKIKKERGLDQMRALRDYAKEINKKREKEAKKKK